MLSLRLRIAIPLFLIAVAANAQEGGAVRWRRFRSERWGFRMQLPQGWPVVFSGPLRAGCSGASGSTTVRPTWVVPRRGDEPDTITVSFVRAPFDDVARNEGFALEGLTWFYGSDSATLTRGDQWQAVEGQDTERIEHPGAAPGEPSFDFDVVFRAVARFDLAATVRWY